MFTSLTSIAEPGTLEPHLTLPPSSRCTPITHALCPSSFGSVARERQHLPRVVLDRAAGGADPVVVPGPAADPDVLGHGDLHVVHVTAVPDRLVHRVGEP